MKVLVIVPDIVPYGGTNRFLEQLLKIHARQSISTVLLAQKELCPAELESLAARYSVELVKSSSRTRLDTMPFLTPVFDFLFCWRTVLSRHPDVIVVSTGVPGRLSISLYFPVPVLYVLHSVPEQRFGLLPRLFLWCGSMLINNRVVAVSNSAAQSVSDTMGISCTRVEVLYNSFSDVSFVKGSDEPIILTAGHMVSYKNPELWLEVACRVLQECPGSVFVWLGDGAMLEAIRRKVERTSFAERIMLPGYVPDPSSWYARAQIYFQPSLRESHGIAVLEAMSHGLPCVVADVGGLPESVVDGETGYVCAPTDVAEYVSRIKDLFASRALRERLGCAGRLRAEKFFTEKVQEAELVKLYDLIAGRSDK